MVDVMVAVVVAVLLGVIDADGDGKTLGSLDDEGVVDGSAPTDSELVGLTDVDAEPVMVAVMDLVGLGVPEGVTADEPDGDAV
jgi:hypothetical protein